MTVEQLRAKDEILMKIEEALNRDKSGQLILINGSAGTGKTVLLSSLFFELAKSSQIDDNKILGVDVDEIIDSKLKKDIAKYPVEKSKGNNKKYTELN
nr:MazG-like family protein [Companilactobacillus sp.]